MTRIIMYGCKGKMGRTISALASEMDDIEIVAGIEKDTERKDGYPDYPVFSSLAACDVDADALIDFSSPLALEDILENGVKRNLPLVLCTTGYSEEQKAKIAEASQKNAILRSANMSLGVNTLIKAVKITAEILMKADFDAEIVEKHHNKKVDAPSGTALAFADAINSVLDEQYDYKYDRSSDRKAREKKEIGISSVRGGNIVGEHEIIFAGLDETIELKHTAYSKAIFGKGALEAARFLNGKKAGMYDMNDVIG